MKVLAFILFVVLSLPLCTMASPGEFVSEVPFRVLMTLQSLPSWSLVADKMRFHKLSSRAFLLAS